jgi:hypothetical protein
MFALNLNVDDNPEDYSDEDSPEFPISEDVLNNEIDGNIQENDLHEIKLDKIDLNRDQISFTKSLQFMLHSGISEADYRKYFLDSSFYDANIHPMTLFTFKRRVLKFVERSFQV